MLAPETVVTLEVTLIGILLVVIDEVHVLHPLLRLDDKLEPDSSKDVHYNKQLEGHHQNFELDLKALVVIRSRHSG